MPILSGKKKKDYEAAQAALQSPERQAQRQKGQEQVGAIEKLRNKGLSKSEALQQVSNPGVNDPNSVNRTVSDVQSNVQAATELQIKQQKEIQAIDALKSSKPQLTVVQRNVQSGIAAANAIGETFGQPAKDINTQDVPLLPAVGLTILGKLVSQEIAGFSISEIFSKSNSGNIKNSKDSAKAMVTESNKITRAATSKGADVQQAIKSATILEEGIRSRYEDALNSLRSAPKEVAEGLDLIDDMSRDLRIAVENKHMLQRYQLTGDPSEILHSLGDQAIQENQ